MTTETANDFLTKQLFIEKKIVTYRSLSRQLGIHVNAAKKELATYYAQSTQSPAPSATYLIIGSEDRHRHEESGMDVDNNLDDDPEGGFEDGEDVPQTKFLLVTDEEFEEAKTKFQQINAVHICSLSPSIIRDAGLLCAPTEDVRRVDNEKGADTVGKVVSRQIQGIAGGRTGQPAASSSNVEPAASAKVPLNATIEKKDKGNEKEKGDEVVKVAKPPMTEKSKEKVKATGKLDFSKAKAKNTVKETNEAKAEQKEKYMESSKSKAEHVAERKKSSRELKRGIKRRSTGVLISDTDETTTSTSDIAKAARGLRIKKGTVLSDDDEMPQPSRRRSKINSAVTSEADSEERSLLAMMDIDDGEVDCVSSSKPESMREGEESDENQNEDMDVTDDPDPAPKPKRRRKEKKEIPRGRNGLKKKRVVKTRTKTDNQGYRVTEDYSSYESVDEEEVEPEVQKKGGKKLTAKKETEESGSVGGKKRKGAKQAGAPSKLGPKGSIVNFFGPASKK